MILAKVFGFYFLGVGIGLLCNTDRFREIYKQMLKTHLSTYFRYPSFYGGTSTSFRSSSIAGY